MSDVGVGYVTLVPTTKGFSNKAASQLKDGLAGPSRQAGETAGDHMGKGIADGVDKGGGRFKAAAGRVGDVFKAGLAAVGVAAGVALAAGLSSGLETEAVTDKFVASMGGGEFAEELGGIAGNLYGDAFGESVADTADAVKKVWQGGLLPEDATNEQIESLTAKVMTFSDVMTQDLDMTTQAVQSMLKSGIVDTADEALDVMTRGIQQGADKAGDFAAVFQEYGTSFREVGISAADAAGLMSQGLASGARDADKVADALKEFGIRAQDGSKAAAEGYAAIGLNAAEMTAKVARGGPEARAALDQVLDGLRAMEDPVARNAAAVGLFGTQAEDLGDALFSLDLDTAAMMLGDTEGATDKLADAYDNASTRIEAFKRQGLQKLTEFIGGTLLPMGQRLVDFFGPVLAAAFDLVGPPVREFVEALDTLVFAFQAGESFGGGGWFDVLGELGAGARQAVDGLSDFFDRLQPVFDYVSEHGELVRGALMGIGIAILSFLVPALVALVAPLLVAVAPFVAIGVAAAAIGAGLVWAYENVEQFRAIVDAVLPQIGELFRSTFDLILAVIDTAVSIGSWLWTNFGDLLIDALEIAMNLLGGIVQNGLDVILGIVQFVTAVLRGDWSAAWDAIKQIVSGALGILGTLIDTALSSIGLAVRLGFRAVKATISLIVTEAWAFVRDKLDGVVGFFRDLPGRIGGAISTLASAITSPFRTAFDSVKSLWNRTAGGFGFSIPDWIPKVGGKSFTIPKMHTGGRFRAPPGQLEGLALLRNNEWVTTPEQQSSLAAAATPSPSAALPALAWDPGSPDLFLEWLRRSIKWEGGGNVQVALGQPGAG